MGAAKLEYTARLYPTTTEALYALRTGECDLAFHIFTITAARQSCSQTPLVTGVPACTDPTNYSNGDGVGGRPSRAVTLQPTNVLVLSLALSLALAPPLSPNWQHSFMPTSTLILMTSSQVTITESPTASMACCVGFTPPFMVSNLALVSARPFLGRGSVRCKATHPISLPVGVCSQVRPRVDRCILQRRKRCGGGKSAYVFPSTLPASDSPKLIKQRTSSVHEDVLVTVRDGRGSGV